MIIKNLKTTKKKYNIIYADPPWKYNDRLNLQNEGAAVHYNTMTHEDLCNLPINNIADKDCVLFMWVTMPMMREGLKLIEAWGFEYKTCAFAWEKLNPKSKTPFKGIGRWVMGNVELCLLATKGKPYKWRNTGVFQLVRSIRREHSRKPDEVPERILQLMGNLPRIELFCREQREGWDVWGNQVDKFKPKKEKKCGQRMLCF